MTELCRNCEIKDTSVWITDKEELRVNYDPAYRVDVILHTLIPLIKVKKCASDNFIEKLEARAIFLAERANLPDSIFDEIDVAFRGIRD